MKQFIRNPIQHLLLSGISLLLLLAGCSTIPPTTGNVVAEKNAPTADVVVMESVEWSEVQQAMDADGALSSWATALDASAEYFARKKTGNQNKFWRLLSLCFADDQGNKAVGDCS